MALSPAQLALPAGSKLWLNRRSKWLSAWLVAMTVFVPGRGLAQQTPPDTTATTVQVSNAYLLLQCDADGRWLLKTTGGNPLTTADNNKPVLVSSSAGFGSRTLIKVDETDATEYGAGGTWYQSPTADEVNDAITSIEDIGTPATLRITRKLSLVRDLLKIEYTVKNTGTVTLRVGLANRLDTAYGEDSLPNIIAGGPFYAPTLGSVTTEKSITSSLPDIIYGFDNLPDYAFPTQTILRGYDVTTPNKVLMVQGNLATGDFWDYVVSDFVSILEDSALVLFYNQQSVTPGGQLAKIVSYHGLAQATTEPLYPVTIALQSPFSVDYNRASTDTVGKLTPDPLTVYGYVYNQNTELKQQDVQVHLTVSDGLEFMPGELPTKTIGMIGAGQEEVTSWQIRSTSTVVGPVSFTMSVVGSLAPAKSVTRTINIPAVEQTTLPSSTWRLMSVPFLPDNSDPQALFNLSAGTFLIKRYNAEISDYETVTDVQPGEAFWMMSVPGADVTLQDVLPLANSDSEPYTIDLDKGWNQIGNPYLYSVPLG
ncbi:MAG: hypothetical protein WCL39_09810, partial [Armatimonadota bacterium]